MADENNVQELLDSLDPAAARILNVLYVPFPLVQAGRMLETFPDLLERFESARLLYRQKQFKEACEAFLGIHREGEERAEGVGRTALLNAAAAAIAMKGSEYAGRVVTLLEPLYASGQLFGLPLWNLSLAYFRLGRSNDALEALKAWLPRARDEFAVRGLLVAAILALRLGRREEAETYLRYAFQRDPTTVYRFLGQPSSVPAGSSIVTGTPQLPEAEEAEVRKWLASVIRPRRPERHPELAATLGPDELSQYEIAREALAEEVQRSVQILSELHDLHPDMPSLKAALGAAYLFAGQNEDAREVLERAVALSSQPSGTTLWNLACAQLRAGSPLKDVETTLRLCEYTEYRSNPALHSALAALRGQPVAARVGPPAAARPGLPVERLAEGLPRQVDEARRELLRRLVRPRKLAASYTPDLGRLVRRDQATIERALRAARQMGPADAFRSLEPLLEEFGDLYTLKVHAAAFLLLKAPPDWEQARGLLQEAQQLRPLDDVSRVNLAYTYLLDERYGDVAEILEGGARSNLGSRAHFWLMVAVARALAGRADAGEAAGRAVATADPSQGRHIERALHAAGITVIPLRLGEDRVAQAVNEAIRALASYDHRTAADLLNSFRVPAVEIPEIGTQVFEPDFEWRVPAGAERYLSSFRGAVQAYDRGEFENAGELFDRISRVHRVSGAARLGAALNGIAAYLRAGQRTYALRIASRLRRILSLRRPETQWPFRLAYNVALAYFGDGRATEAIQLLERFVDLAASPRLANRLNQLIAAISDGQADNPRFRKSLATALDRIRSSLGVVSKDLLLTLVWARLGDPRADLRAVQQLLRDLRDQASRIPPPAQISSMRQLREVYDAICRQSGTAAAIPYLEAVIDIQGVRRRPGLRAQELVHRFGIELVARLCLSDAHRVAGRFEEALYTLEDAEAFVEENCGDLPPGFQARHWLELAKSAQSLGLIWAAMRYCERALQVDEDLTEAAALRQILEQQEDGTLRAELTQEARALASAISGNDAQDPLTIRTLLLEHRDNARRLRSKAGVLVKRLREVLELLEVPERFVDLDELAERVRSHGRVLLPPEARQEIDAVLDWVRRLVEQQRAAVSVEVMIHGDCVWVRPDEREATLTLRVAAHTSAGTVRLVDAPGGRVLWEGRVDPGSDRWIRHVLVQDEGFTPGEPVDFAVDVVPLDPPGQPARVRLSATVAGAEPTFPSYIAGPLSPEEASQLYGRSRLLDRIRAVMGPRRASQTLFITAPRLMGKTSLLLFVEQSVPEHLMAVYVNLEFGWGEETGTGANLWAYLTRRVTEVAQVQEGQEVQASPHRVGFDDFGRAVRSLLLSAGKQYVLLLLDEFHVMLERAQEPARVLDALRACIQDPKHKISILIADRWTLAELASRLPHDIWAQLTEEELGPLDRNALREALTTPARDWPDWDLDFPDETLDRIHWWTMGYPYHAIKMAQKVADRLRESGPWTVALVNDVDHAVPDLLSEDMLFTEGLCRADRIDEALEDAIVALIEWRDSTELFHQVAQDHASLEDNPNWAALGNWRPELSAFLYGIGNPNDLLARLAAVGVARKTDAGYAVFSPLLESWLRKVRDERRSLRRDPSGRSWSVTAYADGARKSWEEWSDLDAQLITECERRHISPPLKAKAQVLGSWQQLVKPVSSQGEFESFVDAVRVLFVEGRWDNAMEAFPWLAASYHRARLVRNYIRHGQPSEAAKRAWDELCARALGRVKGARQPVDPQEWRALQEEVLRMLYLGLYSALSAVRAGGA